MSAERELLCAYREWHRLALAESKAIHIRNWSLFSDCHQAIQDYQSLVVGLTQEVRAEWRRTGGPLALKENHLRAHVSGLIELTRQNQTRLRAALTAARQQLEYLGEAGKNLKRLHRTYGLAAEPGQLNSAGMYALCG
jgi:hypothetical protein